MSIEVRLQSCELRRKSELDGDFTEVIAGGLQREGVGRLVEGEHAVDHRLDLIDLDRLNQLFEVATAADADSVQVALLEHEAVRIGVAFAAGEHADERNLPSPTDAVKRARERADAAIFDHAIDAATVGELENFLLDRKSVV